MPTTLPWSLQLPWSLKLLSVGWQNYSNVGGCAVSESLFSISHLAVTLAFHPAAFTALYAESQPGQCTTTFVVLPNSGSKPLRAHPQQAGYLSIHVHIPEPTIPTQYSMYCPAQLESKLFVSALSARFHQHYRAARTQPDILGIYSFFVFHGCCKSLEWNP